MKTYNLACTHTWRCQCQSTASVPQQHLDVIDTHAVSLSHQSRLEMYWLFIASRLLSKLALACITSSATEMHRQQCNLYPERCMWTRTPCRHEPAFVTPGANKTHCQEWDLHPRSHTGTSPKLAFASATHNSTKKLSQKMDLNPRPHVWTL